MEWCKPVFMKKYYLHDGTTQHGPFDLSELEGKIITPQTLVWYESLPNWKPAAEIEEFSELLNKKVPAARVTAPPVLAAKSEDWTAKMYHYADSHGQHGPFTWEQLKNRGIQAETPVWYDPLPEWTTAGKIPGLVPILPVQPQRQELVQPQQPQPSGRQYYFLDSAHQKNGPFSIDQLKDRGLRPQTMVWHEPLPNWVEASKIEELKTLFATTPAPVTGGGRKYYFLDSAGKQQGPVDPDALKSRGIQADTMIWYESLPNWIQAGAEPALKDILTSPGGDWSKKAFYFTDSQGQKGPFTLEQMKTQPLTAATPVWYDPLPNWTTAGQVEPLRPFLR